MNTTITIMNMEITTIRMNMSTNMGNMNILRMDMTKGILTPAIL
jgi:hypothetical protein